MSLDSKVLIEKRAGETLLVAMDFGPWLTSDETIDSITSITFNGADSSVSYTNEQISGSRVTLYLSGGTAGVRYEVKIKITTSLNQIFIGEGSLRVVAN